MLFCRLMAPLLFAGLLCLPIASQAAPPRLVFLGFDLINTSLEPTSSAEKARLMQLDALFKQQVAASPAYDLVALSQAVQADLDAANEIRNCNGCERDFAVKAGADLAAWGTVQKVSNLILNINLYVEDAASGRMIFVKSVDIRGNTDESWQHGLRYLLRNYLLKDGT